MRASHIVHTAAEEASRQAEVEATKIMLADMFGTQDDSSLKVGDVNNQVSENASFNFGLAESRQY